jgi:hypothetical protein
MPLEIGVRGVFRAATSCRRGAGDGQIELMWDTSHLGGGSGRNRQSRMQPRFREYARRIPIIGIARHKAISSGAQA